MDPDPEAGHASQIIKTAFISLVFSTCHYSSEETDFHYTATHQVTRPPDQVVIHPVKKKKKIYLTFDDGPNKGTKKVMHIANEEEVPVTLFLVGEHVFDSPYQEDIFDSLEASGNIELANHSYTHAHNHYAQFYSQADSVVSDFERCEDSLHFTEHIGRTPGRNIWRTQTLRSTDLAASAGPADSLQKKGFSLIGWDLEWHFDKNLCLVNCADSVYKQIDSLFKKGRTKNRDHLVLLAHDQVYADADDSIQLRKLVSSLKKNGEYEFEFISRYPGVKNSPEK